MKIRSEYWLVLNYLGYFCAYGVFVPLIPVWLQTQAYSDEKIALLLAFAYVFRFLGGIFFSSRIKDTAHLPAILRNLALGSALTILAMGLSALHWHSFLMIFILFAVFSIVNGAGMPLQDSLASIWNQQIGLDYGKVRLTGSLGFVIGVVVFGGVVSYLGNQSIIWVLTGLLMIYTCLHLPIPTILPKSTAVHAAQASVSYRDLLRESNTVRLLVAVSLIQGAHGAYYAYSTIYWVAQGINIQTTSWLWGISVIAEVALFFFASRLFKKWNITALFILSISAAIIRWMWFPILKDVWALALLQTLHAFTYAAAHFATVRYISSQPATHIAKLQALYNGLSSCIAVAALTALSGLLYSYEPSYAFWGMAIIVAFAFLFLPKSLPRIEQIAR